MSSIWDALKQTFSENAANVAIRIVIALVILVLGFLLIKWIMRLIFKKSRLKERMEPSAFTFLRSMTNIVLKVVLVMVAAATMGIPTASIIALIGSAGLAIGLALQGSLSNLAGGMMILIFKPFLVGDYIEPANADAGTVKDISILYTTLITSNNQTVVIPNGELSNKPLTNFSRMDTRRLSMRFSVAYDSDIDQVKALILQAAKNEPLVQEQPEPYVRLRQLGESALVFELRAWAETKKYWKCYAALNEAVKRAFDSNNIAIPYPQLEVHTCSADAEQRPEAGGQR